MSDQAPETTPAESASDLIVQDAVSATEVGTQTVPGSTKRSDNGKLVGWVASAYGAAKMSVRTEKNLRLLERIIDDTLTLVFDLLKLLGEETIRGIKCLYRAITELSPPQTPAENPLPSSVVAENKVALQTPHAIGGGSGSKKYALAKLMQVLERDPDLESHDPELFLKTDWEIVTICAGELNALNIPAAVDASSDSFSWRDQSIAAKARNLSSVGVEHGGKYCLLVGENIGVQKQAVMAALHAMAALVARVDNDYSKAFLHNIKRLEFVRNPDDLSDQVIEGMMADASRASGNSGAAEMLLVFSGLADRKPEWERLTPRLRKILGTD